MTTEFQKNLIPNAESSQIFGIEQKAVVLKPSFSWGILVQVNEMPSADDEEWVKKVDMLLQYGIDVIVSPEQLDLAEVEGYRLVHTPENFEINLLKEFIIENNIEVLDGSSR